MEIKNIEGLTVQELQNELDMGAKFIMFQYCISILVMTFKRGSSIYFIKGNESHLNYQWKHSILTLLAGSWGIPWGPIYTIQSLFNNLSGGKDVTNEVVSALSNQINGEENPNK